MTDWECWDCGAKKKQDCICVDVEFQSERDGHHD